jgi:hypothetical protein
MPEYGFMTHYMGDVNENQDCFLEYLRREVSELRKLIEIREQQRDTLRNIIYGWAPGPGLPHVAEYLGVYTRKDEDMETNVLKHLVEIGEESRNLNESQIR